MKSRFTALFFLVASLTSTASAQSFWTAPTDSFEYSLEDIAVTQTGTVLVSTFLGGAFRSDDRAESWEEVLGEDVNEFAVSDGTLFSAGLGGAFKSTDDGQTWELILPASTVSISAHGEEIVAGGTGGQLYYSANGGASWTLLNCQLMPQGYDDFVFEATITESVIVYEHFLDGLFRSQDSGVTWEADLSSSPTFLRAIDGTLYSSNGDQLMRSEDGLSWSHYARLPFFSADDLAMNGDVWAISSFAGIAFSLDRGSIWSVPSAGLAEDGVNGVAVGPDGYVYAMLDYQVQRSVNPVTQSGTGVAVDKAPVPRSNRILNVYPNPATDRTRVEILVARSGPVVVSVYDETGRKIDTLLSRELRPGRHVIPWRTGHMASGTYFLRMEGTGTVQTMTVIR